MTMMKWVPIVLPWVLAPALFSVVVAAVHAWQTNSLLDALLFVVLPLAAWAAILRGCKRQVRDPRFSPSFIAAVIATDFITDVVVLRPAIGAGMQVVVGLATVNLLFLFWRAVTSDPGRFPAPSENDTWRGNQECESNVPLVEALQAEQMDVNNLKGESSEVRDVEVGKIESFEVSKKFEPHTEEEVDVADAAEEQSPKRLPTRARYCWKCNAWIDHFDHHCPAINNCVGRKNHVLFLGMLLAFIVAELLYVRCCHLYLRSQRLLSPPQNGSSSIPIGLQGMEEAWNVICQVMNRQPWVASTASFAMLQASWQIPLLLFHLYLAAVNLNTNEWLKWQHYPQLHIDVPPVPGRAIWKKKFVNPYDQGVLINLREFLKSRAILEHWARGCDAESYKDLLPCTVWHLKSRFTRLLPCVIRTLSNAVSRGKRDVASLMVQDL